MQITINDELSQQTMQFFNTNNAKLALEKAIQDNSITAAFEELKIL